MNIIPINSINNSSLKPLINAASKPSTVQKTVSNKVIPPFEAIKSKYCLSFGKFKKIGNVVLQDRQTGDNVLASLKREKYGKDYVSYKVFVKNEEAGYMDMDLASVFPEDNNYVITEPDNVIPEIQHLRSLSGEKYAGIGTALVNAAVQESVKRGKGGCLWLTTERGYAWSLSRYRANENPIPFYYKLGFKAVDAQTDKLINQCMEKTKYNMLPDSVLLLLTPEAIKKKHKYFSSNFIVN